MPRVDRGEELVDSDFLPYKNTRGQIKIVHSARVPVLLPKLPKKKRADADKKTTEASSKSSEDENLR